MEVCPFQGIRYNQEVIGDLAAAICPPYDIITPEQQNFYYRTCDYNAIRLELPSEQPGDNNTNNKYSRAAITFKQWLKQGVLQIDDCPTFYLHDHYFEHLGKKKMRRGLIARVKLEPWGTSIYPHEETFSKAKGDRLLLMRACQANFSPLFSLYQDSERKMAQILSKASQGKPIMSFNLSPLTGKERDKGEKHIVWAISDSSLVRQISHFLAAQPLYIADGHHRYETALAYQQERAQAYSEPSPFTIASQSPERSDGAAKQSLIGKEASNYIMMELVDFSDPGLLVLPIHRLVRGIAPSILAELESQLGNFFSLDFVPLPKVLPCHPEPFASCHSEGVLSVSEGIRPKNLAQDKLCEESRPFASLQGAVLGILGLEPQSMVALKQRQDVSIETVMPCNRSQAYKEFSVSLLNHIILDKVLSEAKDLDIAYTVDLSEAYQQIKEGKYQLAFLLNPPQLEIVKAVVSAKDKLPRKSTYFYPKLPAGLIINPFLACNV